jgi:hypothetical protein
VAQDRQAEIQHDAAVIQTRAARLSGILRANVRLWRECLHQALQYVQSKDGERD